MSLFKDVFGQPGGGVHGLLSNPAFMVGAGLLSNNGQWAGAMQGLAAAQGYKLSEAKAKRVEEQEKRRAELEAMQMQALKAAQDREQYTRAIMQGVASGGMTESPEALRARMAMYGDPKMAEAGGLIAPPPTQQKLPTSFIEHQLAQQDPTYKTFLDARAQTTQGPATLFAPQFFEQDGKWYAVQFDNRTGQQMTTAMPEGWRPQSSAATSPGINKIIESQMNAAQQAQQLSSKVDQALSAVNAIPDAEWNAGFSGKAAEAFKSAFGYQDAQTLAKALYSDVRNSGILNSLPPGVASDRDVALVLEGTLPPTAPKALVMQYMRGIQKLAMLRAEYGNFAAEYVSTNPMRGMAGFPQAWNEYLSSKGSPAPGASVVPGSSPAQGARRRYNPTTGEFE